MKQTGRITLCAVMAALACALMLTAYFPYLTYAVPAISGLFIMIPVIELNKKWAFASYAVSAVLVFIFAEPEAKLIYVFLCGYYPILKSVLEHTGNRFVEYLLKFLCFNAALAVIYGLFSAIAGVGIQDMDDFGAYGALLLIAGGNVVFFLYDAVLSKMAEYYMYRLHPRISRYINK